MRRVASMRKAVDKDYRAIDPEDGCDLTYLGEDPHRQTKPAPWRKSVTDCVDFRNVCRSCPGASRYICGDRQIHPGYDE